MQKARHCLAVALMMNTQDHLYQCDQPDMIRTCTAAIVSMSEHLHESGVPEQIHKAFLALVKHYVLGDDLPDNMPPDVTSAVATQLHYGNDLTLHGYLSNKWVTSMSIQAKGQINRRMKALFTGLWSYLFEPIWQQRNDILHKTNSIAAQYEHKQLRNKLIQWKAHSAEQLHDTQQHLTSYTYSEIMHWTIKQNYNGS
jgi:hypothetical protein